MAGNKPTASLPFSAIFVSLIVSLSISLSSSATIDTVIRHLSLNGTKNLHEAEKTTTTEKSTTESSTTTRPLEIVSHNKLKEGANIGEDFDAPALFESHKDFGCVNPKIELETGSSASSVFPGDISVIAAMGDGLSTGHGLLTPLSAVDYRGATFSIGGDATLNDLITIANILTEFNGNLTGKSHGAGTLDELPKYQLNVAKTGASSVDLLPQSKLLVERLLTMRDVHLHEQWVMVIITIGTEETCNNCTTPKVDDLKSTLEYLRQNIPKAFVVIVGPINYWSHFLKIGTYLRNQCPCFKQKSEKEIQTMNIDWKLVCADIEKEFNNDPSNFGVVAVPVISMPSDTSEDLFIPKTVLFNMKGHRYAAKYLWNRMMTGRSYNVSSSPYKDALLCPTLDCPYFRTVDNARNCKTWKYSEVTTPPPPETTTRRGRRRRSQFSLYLTAAVVVALSFCTVFILGTIFYRMKSSDDLRMGA